MTFRRPTLSRSLLLLATFIVGVVVGRTLEAPREAGLLRRSPAPVMASGELPEPVNAALLREVWKVLHEKFAGTLDDEDLARGALYGLVAGAGDPYTSYADPEESRQFEADLSGSFTGVGIEITLRHGRVTVIAPLRDSPAERAGILARDIIVKIDGQEITLTMSLTEIVSKIRGPNGTTVTLTVAREDADELLDIPIRRSRISIESATLERRDDIAIVTISAFNEDTERRFQRLASDLLSSRARGIVLDLRNNPGGILDQAVKIAGHFLPRGTLVVTEAPRDPAKRREYRTDGPGDLATLPTVVIVNGGSASASEILAAALNERREIPLVGDDTFGKGSVQELVSLSDGSHLRVTVGQWQTSLGKEIGEQGIAPTVRAEDQEPTEAPDELLDQAFEELRKQLR